MRNKLLLLIICLIGVRALPLQAQGAGDLLGLINNLRSQHGLPGYTINGALSSAAQQQAQWIIDTGVMAHTHPDGSGPRTRAVAAGYGGALIGENIYGGTNATLNDAWVFWLNSPIHYAGLVNTRYQQVGIGIAHGGWGSSFVIDFGGDGSGGVAAVGGNGSSSGGNQSVAAGPPPYYGGIDEQGNIKHIVQPGETLGDIALLYGYTWSDLPNLMQLNGLTNVRDLAADSIFLVPPKAGTYTPTPDNRPPTETPPPPTIPATITPFVIPTLPPEITELTVVVPFAIATANGNVVPPSFDENASDATPTIEQVAALPTPGTVVAAGVVPARSAASSWILIAVAVQVVIVAGAGIEFIRRALKKRR